MSDWRQYHAFNKSPWPSDVARSIEITIHAHYSCEGRGHDATSKDTDPAASATVIFGVGLPQFCGRRFSWAARVSTARAHARSQGPTKRSFSVKTSPDSVVKEESELLPAANLSTPLFDVTASPSPASKVFRFTCTNALLPAAEIVNHRERAGKLRGGVAGAQSAPACNASVHAGSHTTSRCQGLRFALSSVSRRAR